MLKQYQLQLLRVVADLVIIAFPKDVLQLIFAYIEYFTLLII